MEFINVSWEKETERVEAWYLKIPYCVNASLKGISFKSGPTNMNISTWTIVKTITDNKTMLIIIIIN